jgi:AcrR family transcriptional regulator
MSSDTEIAGVRAPKRARGRQRVTELLEAAAEVFTDKGYDAATMTEIAARAGAPIGSLYQFFPAKEVLADTLVQNYIALLTTDLRALEERAARMDIKGLVDGLFSLLRGHPRERAAALPLVEARMDERTRRATFRPMLRKQICAILRAREPALSTEAARDLAVVVLQLMKAASTLSDEENLPGRATGLRDLQTLAIQYLQQRLGPHA